LKDKSECLLEDFCVMIARTAEMIGVERIGIGSDLCQNQPDSVVEWMRNGTWSNERDFGEGSSNLAGFPEQPKWFRDNRDFENIFGCLRETGFSENEIVRFAGLNWLEFFEKSFGP
jgi:membrane dipeptidase